MDEESNRKTVTVPSELWAKVRIEKIQKGHESLSDVVVKALRKYLPEETEAVRLLRIQVVAEEVKHALKDPLERDELRALYRAYYQSWSGPDLEKQYAEMVEK